jgi:hypothetical protein
MPRTVIVLVFSAAMLATVGFASTNSATGGSGSSPVMRGTPVPSPSPTMQAPAAVNTGQTTIRWDKFYDRSGNPLPGNPDDMVGMDSLYFKDYGVTDSLYGCPKSEVPNPTPAGCRTGFAFLSGQTRVGSDPTCTYIYEVNGTSLRRHSTADGTYNDYTISNGNTCCKTDGAYLYVPVSNIVYKYTLTGTLVNQTTLNITPLQYVFSVANDTVWCGTNDSVLSGYACSEFAGGSITEDAMWSLGTNTGSGVAICSDGSYYYASWNGLDSNSFKRFNADRTISASGTIDMGPFGVMCVVLPIRHVTQDSLYWKTYYSTVDLYSSPKAQDVTAAHPTSFSWQYKQSVPCMTPDGHYVFEVYGTNMRRTSLLTGVTDNYTLADASGGPCGTDGQFVYVPNGTTTRKYSLTGTLVSATTTNYAPWSIYGFGVANDTVWLTPDETGMTWYGYDCSKFTGGSITHDATWATGGGENAPMTVAYDGQYYYVVWGGNTSTTFKRFYRDRTLCSSGTVTGDARSVMCKKGDYAVAILYAASYHGYAANLGRMLVDSSGGTFAAADTYYVGSEGGHATFPATDWYNHGYRAILAFTDGIPEDGAALGDSLARFIQLGGGGLEATFADYSGTGVAGAWRSTYAPFTFQSYSTSPGTMGTVHQPLHPVMSGVSALSVGNYRTGNTHSSLRSANCACLGEYTDGNLSLAASFDSAGQRAASLGFYPLDYWISTATGQWCRLLVNTLDWTAVGPSVGVTVPNGGESWIAGTVHNITWSQTISGVKDSIYYSTDAGSSWTGVAHYDPPPAPLQHTWTVPSTPTVRAQVKVVTWNADGGRVEDVSDANFTIEPFVGIAQPENNALPLAFGLYQSHPNPLASGAAIRYALPQTAQVELRIYDVAGTLVRRLVDGVQPAGYRRAYWNVRDDRGRLVAPGVYYCRFRAGNFLAAQKLVVRR